MGNETTVTLDAVVLEGLQDAIAKATAAATNANAAAASANAAANQASSGSVAGVAGARTQSNKEVDSGTETVFKSVQQDSDIGIPEAWSANVKRTYDLHQSDDFEAKMRNRIQFDSIISEQIKHLANLNQLTITNLANNQNQSNMNNTLGIDRAWNINETDLAAKSVAAITDAVLAKMASKE